MIGLPNQFAGKPKERLFEIVIGLGRDFKVLDTFLPVESHSSGLDLPLLEFQEREVRQLIISEM